MDTINSDLAVEENDQKQPKVLEYLQLMKTILLKEEGIYCVGPTSH
jgi:hypothetical protein